jgi:hypothetical protein
MGIRYMILIYTTHIPNIHYTGFQISLKRISFIKLGIIRQILKNGFLVRGIESIFQGKQLFDFNSPLS